MKLRFIFLLFLSILGSQAKVTAQHSGKVIYKVRSNPNFIYGNILFNMLPEKEKDSILKLPKKQKDKILSNYQKQTDKGMQRMAMFDKKIMAIASDFEYILEFNQTESVYRIDTPMRDESVNKSEFVLAKLEAGGDFIYYAKRFDSVYLMTNPLKKPEAWTKYKLRKWTITNETGKLGKYKVIKAVSGKVSAWFAPDIPVSFGPQGYGGLPGLILQVDAGVRQVYAYKIILSDKSIKMPRPQGEIIDAKEWRHRRDVKKAKALSGFIKK